MDFNKLADDLEAHAAMLEEARRKAEEHAENVAKLSSDAWAKWAALDDEYQAALKTAVLLRNPHLWRKANALPQPKAP